MKAVVMAGGQGTRLRPLTSNQPKPMVPVVNKPTAHHILELLGRHGIRDIVMTVAFLPQLIQNHFGDGSSLGMSIEYSVEEMPLGTAGSVKNAQSALDDTFLVISGDALTDFDLSAIIAFHRERQAMVTIALKSVDNPLEFGVVIVDDEGRVERFLEKPGWGQVFSDTINTGIYVLEPEVLDHVPAEIPFDFSHELFPKLFDMRKPLYGVLCDDYWQDIGNFDQYMQANRDALDGKVRLELPGVRLRGNVWVGQGVSLDNLENVVGPALIGNYAKIDPTAVIGAHTVLGNNVVMRTGAQVASSVVGENGYLGVGSRVRGAVLGNSVDIRAGAVVSEGAVIGDQCSVGESALIGNNVKIYPSKAVDPGSAVKSSLIWETRGMSSLFGKHGVRGLINIDITPETAIRLALSYGTLLSKDAQVTASRDSHPASRVLKRAMIAGLNATGVSVRDLRVASPSLSRFDLRRGDVAGSIHVRISPESPEEVEILFAEPPGVPISAKTERSIENYFHREDFRRASYEEMGTISFPPRVVETYQETLLDTWDTESIARSGFRAVIDYNYSPASLVSGGILDRAGVEGIGLNAYATDKAALLVTPGGPEAREKVKRLVAAVGADLGVLFDPSAESLALLDERGEPVPDATLLLLLLGHACRTQGPGRVVLPLHITRQAEHAAEHCGATVVRTRVSEASLMAEAAQPGTIFAGMLGGRYIFPTFVSSPDALFAFGKVLELMAHSGKSLSELQAEMPQVHLQHAEVPCPWHLKGSVMRFMIEEVKEERVSLVDGIKITVGDGDWVQILPDADDPVFHVYAESGDPEGAARLVETYTARLHVVVASREGTEV